MTNDLSIIAFILFSIFIIPKIYSVFYRFYENENNENGDKNVSKLLTSKQIHELDRMNFSSQKSAELSLHNSVSDDSNSFLQWKLSTEKDKTQQPELLQQKKISGNCEYCGTGYFEDDRNCVNCGGKIKRYEEIKNGIIENSFSKMTVQEIKNEYWSLIDSGRKYFLNSDYFKVVNLSSYKLNLKSLTKTYSFDGFGSYKNIQYDELKDIIFQRIEFIDKGIFVIMNKDLIRIHDIRIRSDKAIEKLNNY